MDRDVTVLGAGIVGICSALALSERGLRVRLIDRDAPGQATSSGNAGVISPWSIVPQSMPGLWKKIPRWLLDPLGPVAVRPTYLPRLAGWGLRFLAEGREARVRQISAAMEVLNADCVTQYRQLLAGTRHEDLIRDSFYVHAFRDGSAASLGALEHRIRRAAGAPLDLIGPAELRALEPALSHDFQAAILIKDQARALSPGRLGAVLADKLRSQGGDIRRASIRALQPGEAGWTCITDAGRFTSSKVVLAMGVWSAEVLRPLGVRIPLQSERGYHVCFNAAAGLLNNSVMDVDRMVVASSLEDGLRIAGTAEFAGLDAPASPRRIDALVELSRRLVPDLQSATYTTWSGQRPSLPDSLPCIGEIAGLPGLIAAFGHSHYGLMMAPGTGRMVADIATGTAMNIDLSPYSPKRF